MDDAVFGEYGQTCGQVIERPLDRHGDDLRPDGGEVAARRVQVDESLAAEGGREQVGEAFPEEGEGGGRPRETGEEHRGSGGRTDDFFEKNLDNA